MRRIGGVVLESEKKSLYRIPKSSIKWTYRGSFFFDVKFTTFRSIDEETREGRMINELRCKGAWFRCENFKYVFRKA